MANKYTFGSGPDFGSNNSFGQATDTGFGEDRAPSIDWYDLDDDEKDVYSKAFAEIYDEEKDNEKEARLAGEDALFNWRNNNRYPALTEAGLQALTPNEPANLFGLPVPALDAGKGLSPNADQVDWYSLTDEQKDVYAPAFAAVYDPEKKNEEEAKRAGMRALGESYVDPVETAYNNALNAAFGGNKDAIANLTEEQKAELRTLWEQEGARALYTRVNGRPFIERGMKNEPGQNYDPAFANAWAAAEQERLEREQREEDDAHAGQMLRQREMQRQLEQMQQDGVLSTGNAQLDSDAENILYTLQMENQAGREIQPGVWDEMQAALKALQDPNGGEWYGITPEQPQESFEDAFMRLDGVDVTSLSQELQDDARRAWDEGGTDGLEKWLSSNVYDYYSEQRIDEALRLIDERLADPNVTDEEKEQLRSYQDTINTWRNGGDVGLGEIMNKLGAVPRPDADIAKWNHKGLRDALEPYIDIETFSHMDEATKQAALHAWNAGGTEGLAAWVRERGGVVPDQAPEGSISAPDFFKALQEENFRNSLILAGALTGNDLSGLEASDNYKNVQNWAEQNVRPAIESAKDAYNAALDITTMMSKACVAGLNGWAKNTVEFANAVGKILDFESQYKAIMKFMGQDIDSSRNYTDEARDWMLKGFEQGEADAREASNAYLDNVRPQVEGMLQQLGMDDVLSAEISNWILEGVLQSGAENYGNMLPSVISTYLTGGGFGVGTEGAGFIGRVMNAVQTKGFFTLYMGETGEMLANARAAYGDNMTWADYTTCFVGGFVNSVIEYYETKWGLGNGLQTIAGLGYFPNALEYLAGTVSEMSEEVKQHFNGYLSEDMADFLSGRPLRHALDTTTKESLFNTAEYLDIIGQTALSTAGMNLIGGIGSAGAGMYRRAVENTLNGTATEQERQMAAKVGQMNVAAAADEAREMQTTTPDTETQHDLFEAAVTGNKEVRTGTDGIATTQAAVEQLAEQPGWAQVGEETYQGRHTGQETADEEGYTGKHEYQGRHTGAVVEDEEGYTGRHESQDALLEAAAAAAEEAVNPETGEVEEQTPADQRIAQLDALAASGNIPQELIEKAKAAGMTATELVNHLGQIYRELAEGSQQPGVEAPETDRQSMAEALRRVGVPETVVQAFVEGEITPEQAQEMLAGEQAAEQPAEVAAESAAEQGTATGDEVSEYWGGQVPDLPEGVAEAAAKSGMTLEEIVAAIMEADREATEKVYAVLTNIGKDAKLDNTKGLFKNQKKAREAKSLNHDIYKALLDLGLSKGQAKTAMQYGDENTGKNIASNNQHTTAMSLLDNDLFKAARNMLRWNLWGDNSKLQALMDKLEDGDAVHQFEHAVYDAASHPESTQFIDKPTQADLDQRLADLDALRAKHPEIPEKDIEAAKQSGITARQLAAGFGIEYQGSPAQTAAETLEGQRANWPERTQQEEDPAQAGQQIPNRRGEAVLGEEGRTPTMTRAEQELARQLGITPEELQEMMRQPDADVEEGSRTAAAEDDTRRAQNGEPQQEEGKRRPTPPRQEQQQQTDQEEARTREQEQRQAQTPQAAPEEPERTTPEKVDNATERIVNDNVKGEEGQRGVTTEGGEQKTPPTFRKDAVRGEDVRTGEQKEGTAEGGQQIPNRRGEAVKGEDVRTEGQDIGHRSAEKEEEPAKPEGQQLTAEQEQQMLQQEDEPDKGDSLVPNGVTQMQTQQEGAPKGTQQQTTFGTQKGSTTQQNRNSGSSGGGGGGGSMSVQQKRQAAQQVMKRAGLTSQENQAGITIRTWSGNQPSLTQLSEMKTYDQFAKQHGFSIVMEDHIDSPNGSKVNGYYSYRDKNGIRVIHIAQDADSPWRTVISHELVHMIKTTNPQGYARLMDIYSRAAGRQGADLSAIRDSIMKAYRSVAGKSLLGITKEEILKNADEEMLANAVFDVLGDRDAVQELAAKDRTTLEKIKDWIDKVRAEIKAMLDRYVGRTPEAKVLARDLKALDEMRKTMEDALDETDDLREAKKEVKAVGSNGEISERFRDSAEKALSRKEMNRAALNTFEELADKMGLPAEEKSVENLIAAAVDFAAGGGTVSESLKRYGITGAQMDADSNRAFAALGRYLREMQRNDPDAYMEMMRRYALEEAQGAETMENVQNNLGGKMTPAVVTDSSGIPAVDIDDQGTVSRFSLTSWNNTDKDEVRRDLLRAGYNAEEVDKWIDDVSGVAKYIADHRDQLDYDADQEMHFVKPNAEYTITLDASTLCAKRRLYQGIFDQIQKQLPNTALQPGDLAKLINMMNDKKLKTPCSFCYVESRRKWLGRFAKRFLKKYEEAPHSYIPRIEELTTVSGLAKLREEHREAYNDFIAEMNSKGPSNPKVVQPRTDYRNRELLSALSKSQVEKLIHEGGVRIQSFSDFETPHLIDMMQVVLDMASMGLTSQAYTKIPEFAWVFGDTGIKINLSLVGLGTGVDENGKLIFDDKEGMNSQEAFRLRERYSKHVGTILVGINDQHILAAMADDRIDFIIPFHTSGWSKTDIKLNPLVQYYDIKYQKLQNERYFVRDANGNFVRTGKGQYKSTRIPGGNLYPSDYWDYSKSGTENAKRYLELCAEQGRIPKFYHFLVDNGDGSFSLQPDGSTDGYWKLLIDFKMYDNNGVGSPQTKVKPIFNMEQAHRVLSEYNEDPNSLPYDQDIVDRFVDDYKDSHRGVKYSLAPSEAAQRDEEYRQAVEDGDMETAQRMVDQAAEDAGYVPVGRYHQTGEKFTKFSTDNPVAGANDSETPNGIFLKDNDHDIGVGADYVKLGHGGGIQMKLYIKADRMLHFKNREQAKAWYIRNIKGYGELSKEWERLFKEKYDSKFNAIENEMFKEETTSERYDELDEQWNRLIEECREEENVYRGKMRELLNQYFLNGHSEYDGIELDYDGHRYIDGKRENVHTFIVFDPSQVKSADPITYDDNGNVIPLSERFNPENDDIRWSLSNDETGSSREMTDEEIRDMERDLDEAEARADELEQQLRYAESAARQMAMEALNREEEIARLKKKMANRAEVREAQEEARKANRMWHEALDKQAKAEMALLKVTMKKDELQAQLNEQKKEWKKQIRDREERRMQKNKQLDEMMKDVAKLNKFLEHPSKNKGWVPPEYTHVVAEFIAAVSEGRGEKAINLGRRLQKALNEADRRDEAFKFSPGLRGLVTETLELMEDLKTREGTKGMIRNAKDFEINAIARTAAGLVHEITMMDTIIGQEKVAHITTAAHETVQLAEKTKAKTRGLFGLLRKYELAHLNPRTLFQVLGKHADNAVTRMGEEGQKAQRHQDMVAMQSGKVFTPLAEGQNAKKYTEFDDEFFDTGIPEVNFNGKPTGKTMRITHNMLCSLYMHWNAEKNREGMKVKQSEEEEQMYGPLYQLSIPNEELMKKGKVSEAVEQGTRFALKTEQIEALLQKMTDYDREWCEKWREAEQDIWQKELNETSLKLNGFEIAREENYYPITRDQNYVGHDFDTVKVDNRIANMGSLKERVDSHKPMVLMPITMMVERQTRDVSRYAGNAIFIRDFTMWYNAVMPGDGNSVKEAIKKNWGSEVARYLEELAADLNGGNGAQNSFLDKLRGKYAAGVLNANMAVTVKQAASYAVAAGVVSWKSLNKALPYFLMSDKISTDLIDKWCAGHYMRRSNKFTDMEANAGRQSVISKATNKFLSTIQAMDVKTTKTLWMAAEFEIRDTKPGLKVGSDEYYRAVADKYMDILETSQPGGGVMQQNAIQRSKSQIVRAVTMFKSQLWKNNNLIVNAVTGFTDAKEALREKPDSKEAQEKLRQAKVNLAQVLSGQVASSVFLAVLTMLGKALFHKMRDYEDEKGDMTPESVSKKLMRDAIGSFAGMIGGGTELYDLIIGLLDGQSPFDIEAAGISTINDLYQNTFTLLNKMQVIGDSSKTTAQKLEAMQSPLWKFASSFAQMFGLPLGNVRNLVDGIAANAKDFAAGKPGSFENGGLSFLGAAQGRETSNSAVASYIAKAMADGNEEEAARLYNEQLRQGKSADSLNSAILSWQKENYPAAREAAAAIEAGDINLYNQKIQELVDSGISLANAVKMVESLRKKAASAGGTAEAAGTAGGGSMSYADIVAGMTSASTEKTYGGMYTNGMMNSLLEDGNVEAAIKVRDAMMASGKTKSSINSSLTSYWKERVIEAYNSGDMAQVRELTNMLVSMGLNRSTISNWMTPGSSSSSSSKKSGFGSSSGFGKSKGFGSSSGFGSKKKSGFGSGKSGF